jgi:uncharacterized protein YbcV (DUF1398 family)
MSKAIENLEAAQRKAMAIRPKVGGFPYLAEALRQAGVTRNIWSLPSAQSLFITKEGSVVTQALRSYPEPWTFRRLIAKL